MIVETGQYVLNDEITHDESMKEFIQHIVRRMYDIVDQGPMNFSGILHQCTRGHRTADLSQKNSSRFFPQPKDEQYYRLPAVFEVQDYLKCLSQRENAFCAGVFELSSPGPSQLYDVLKKFSTNKGHNFNHTRIHRAVCLGPKSDCPVKNNLKESFEECIDRHMFEEYGLRADLIHFDFCRRSGEKLEIDGVVIAFCVYLIIVVVLNVVGTVYDWVLHNSNENAKAVPTERSWLKRLDSWDKHQQSPAIFKTKTAWFKSAADLINAETKNILRARFDDFPEYRTQFMEAYGESVTTFDDCKPQHGAILTKVDADFLKIFGLTDSIKLAFGDL
ncbi:hypothetical protein EVAR_70945_1 [Eumeta japonica]|uniref:Uncharacterized protein n=1 Tax=Eumeta variegata TaxID=151549 RepID=A0A4C1ZUL8_EUMVA|nr:hypothetical protein EVAR_70945_1 [Eumeta japonica]